MALEFERLNPTQIAALDPLKTVFFFGLGVLEDHGPHLPVALDVIEARALCQRAGARTEAELSGWTAVMMPTLPLGIDGNTQVGRISVRAHVLRDWLVDATVALTRRGFCYFVCYSGGLTPKQLTGIEDAAKMIWKRGRARGMRRRPALMSVSSALVSIQEIRQSLLWPSPAEHGGRRDTSVALAIAPDLVDPSYAALPVRTKEEAGVTDLWKRLRGGIQGYWGDPRGATAEEGERIMKNSIDDSWPKIRAVLEAGPARGMFRSWYSIVPIHKSFFKAYALAFAFCLIVLAWMWMNINAVLGAEPAPAATNYPALVKADPSWGKVTLREPTPSRLDGCHAERVHLTAEDPIFHGEGETVFDDYVPDTTPVGTVLIVPPTGGENVIDRLYARVLCKHGIAAALVKHWPNDTIGGRDVRVHDQYFLGAVVALKRVRHAVQAARGGQVGVLGTSLGSLASLQLLENDSQIQSGVLIVSGAPLSKILATSDLKQLVAQRADRYQAWGITTPEEYERRLAAEIQLDTAKLSPGLRSKNLLQYIGLKDTTVPTETQLTLWEAAGHPPGDRYESNHVPTVEKTFWHHREDIAQFFLKAFRN